jgi:hypothetical protein
VFGFLCLQGRECHGIHAVRTGKTVSTLHKINLNCESEASKANAVGQASGTRSNIALLTEREHAKGLYTPNQPLYHVDELWLHSACLQDHHKQIIL